MARFISFLAITIRVSHTNADTVEISAICTTLTGVTVAEHISPNEFTIDQNYVLIMC